MPIGNTHATRRMNRGSFLGPIILSGLIPMACDGRTMAPSDAMDNAEGGVRDAANSCPGLGRDDLPTYELESYTGSTEGLCPAPHAVGCYSCPLDRGPYEATIGAPPDPEDNIWDGFICEFVISCPMDPECGWDVRPRPAGRFGRYQDPLVPTPPLCRICTRDTDCDRTGGGTCTRRVSNLMMCTEPDDGFGHWRPCTDDTDCTRWGQGTCTRRLSDHFVVCEWDQDAADYPFSD